MRGCRAVSRSYPPLASTQMNAFGASRRISRHISTSNFGSAPTLDVEVLRSRGRRASSMQFADLVDGAGVDGPAQRDPLRERWRFHRSAALCLENPAGEIEESQVDPRLADGLAGRESRCDGAVEHRVDGSLVEGIHPEESGAEVVVDGGPNRFDRLVAPGVRGNALAPPGVAGFIGDLHDDGIPDRRFAAFALEEFEIARDRVGDVVGLDLGDSGFPWRKPLGRGDLSARMPAPRRRRRFSENVVGSRQASNSRFRVLANRGGGGGNRRCPGR